MKNLVLTLLFFLSINLCFSQTTPFRFKNSRIENSRKEYINTTVYDKISGEDSISIPKDAVVISEDSISISKIIIKEFLPYVITTSKSTSSLDDNDNYYFTIEKTIIAIVTQKNQELERAHKIKGDELIERLNNTNIIDERELKKIKDELEYIEGQFQSEKKNIERLKDVAKEMNYKGRNLNNLKLFPVKNAIDAQLYYDYYINDSKNRFLKNTIISFSSEGNKASIFNELYADYFGPFRLGIGVLLSNVNNSDDSETNPSSTQKDAVQRLLGGGGNTTLNLGFPLVGYINNAETFSFKLAAAPKFAVDIPKIGTSSDKYSTNLDLGLEGSVFYTGILNVLTFYANVRIGYINGNEEFYNNLLKQDSKSFSFNQTSIGVALNSTFRISYNFYWGNSFIKDNFPANISVSIIPN